MASRSDSRFIESASRGDGDERRTVGRIMDVGPRPEMEATQAPTTSPTGTIRARVVGILQRFCTSLTLCHSLCSLMCNSHCCTQTPADYTHTTHTVHAIVVERWALPVRGTIWWYSRKQYMCEICMRCNGYLARMCSCAHHCTVSSRLSSEGRRCQKVEARTPGRSDGTRSRTR